MTAHSHVDLCMFIQILEVNEANIPTELVETLLSRDYSSISKVLNGIDSVSIFSRDVFIHPETNLHESVHVIQAVIYPFLRWYAMGAFKTVVDVFRELDDLLKITSYDDVNSYHIPIFSILEVDYYIWDLSKKVFGWTYKHEIGISLDEKPPRNLDALQLIRLNAVDLIENAASLIQYKISSGIDFPSWREFSRWSKRNRSYVRVIDFVRDYIGDDDLAVRIFCPLVQVAFETNQPVRAFMTLLGALKYNNEKGNLSIFIEQKEPCRWIELFDTYMDMIDFDEADYGDIASTQFFRLDRYLTSNFRLSGQLGHPVIGNFSKLWGELERSDLSYRYAFTAPNGYAKQINEISEIFRAPITLLKFSIRGENVVLVAGDLQRMGLAMVDGVSEADMRGVFIDFLLMFSVARGFGNALMDPDFRLCHHKDCPLYQRNYCNMWIFIPKKFEECGFLDRVKYVKSRFASTEISSKTRLELVLMDGPK